MSGPVTAPVSEAPPERFSRDYGCTEADWLRCLPGAVHGHDLQRVETTRARVEVAAGWLDLHWTVLPPRRIALIVLPRLQVDFHFDAVAPEIRGGFMRRFDLFMQRGGG